ncbi:hypothetical protein [Amycolatopsis taiwanensis]|uniref:hypothetical protein n=1 Tax=Amycolatopsis taiwanensis TaxID=342230 RepID=UPI0012EC8073|nr:hypothetical protein [Amycolatopsis taiwanensis]
MTGDEDSARRVLAERYGLAGQIAGYRAALDREGVSGPEHTAILGDETSVEREIRRLFDAGATELVAMPLGTPARTGTHRRVDGHTHKLKSLCVTLRPPC